MKNISIVVVVMCLLVAFTAFLNWRDNQIAQASDKYAECVSVAYKVSPVEFYQENGYYPECYKYDDI